MAEAKGLELVLTPIGREAFVFFVNAKNTAENLSTEDIKRIYSGEVTNWREVGGKNDDIRAYQRPDESGSQTMLKEILDGSPLIAAPQEDIFDLMMGMYQRVAAYRNYKNSLGYSFLFYIKDMINGNKVKFHGNQFLRNSRSEDR
jgi:phosphate transport system substrate-binding protein